MISSHSPSVKIQIMVRKVCLRRTGKTLLGIVNKVFVFKSFWQHPAMFCLSIFPAHYSNFHFFFFTLALSSFIHTQLITFKLGICTMHAKLQTHLRSCLLTNHIELWIRSEPHKNLRRKCWSRCSNKSKIKNSFSWKWTSNWLHHYYIVQLATMYQSKNKALTRLKKVLHNQWPFSVRLYDQKDGQKGEECLLTPHGAYVRLYCVR